MGARIERIAKRTCSIFCMAALLFTGTLQPELARSASTGEVINDVATAMSADGYAFDHAYVKPGDTLKVLYTQDGTTQEVSENVAWTVRKVTGGESENKVSYKIVDELSQPSLPVKEEYLESIIYGVIGETKLTIYCSKTPVIYINSETEYYDVTKDKYTDEDTTSIHLVGNDTYADDTYWYNGTGQVKLRGNSTAKRPKRPFKMKLSKKADLLGLGKEKQSDGKEKSYASKHWVLLANDIDHSLLRNKLLYDFSGDIGTEFYFHSTNVTMIYNGQYEGVYQLCEHRRVDPGRIDITDWTGIGEDAAEAIAVAEGEARGWTAKEQKSFNKELEAIFASDYSWIDGKKITYTGKSQSGLTGQSFNLADYGITLPKTNGGFLAEMDFYSIGKNTMAGMETNYRQPLYFSAPEPGEDAETEQEAVSIVNSFKKTSLYNNANKYTQTFEYALHSDDFYFKNSAKKYRTSQTGFPWEDWANASYAETSYSDDENDGKHYSELFDMDSLVNNFLFCEYAMNWDSMKNSFFYYKDVDELAKIGPQWDFDWCWGNTNMYDIYTYYPTDWQTTIEEFTVEQYYQSVQWNRMLIRDPYFLTLAYEKYKEIRPTVIEDMIKEGGLLDQYEAYLKEAGASNDARWQYTYGTEYSGAVADNFEDSVAHIRNFLNRRVKWLDQQFASVTTLAKSLGYYKTSSDIALTGKLEGEKVNLTAEVRNAKATKICFQINGTTQITADVKSGSASISLDKSQLKGTGLNTVVANEINYAGDYLYLESASKTGNYNIVRSDYMVFDITDPASFDKEVTLPEEDSEVLTGTGWWTHNQRGRDYTLKGNGTIELDVEVQELTQDGSFTVELVAQDAGGNKYYLTTNSTKEVWTAGASKGWGTLSGDNVPAGTGVSTLTEGHTYHITIWRSNKDINVKYYDITADQLYGEFKWSGGNMPDTVNANVIAQTGTYKVILQRIRFEVPAGTSQPPVTDDKTGKPDDSVTQQIPDTQKKNVTLGKAAISSIKNKKKNTVVFKIKKMKNATGYQYSYSTNKKFKKSKTKTKTTKKLSVTLKKLKKKKTYYVRVRAYSVVDKKKKYGKWSKSKSIKIKK